MLAQVDFLCHPAGIRLRVVLANLVQKPALPELWWRDYQPEVRPGRAGEAAQHPLQLILAVAEGRQRGSVSSGVGATQREVVGRPEPACQAGELRLHAGRSGQVHPVITAEESCLYWRGIGYLQHMNERRLTALFSQVLLALYGQVLLAAAPFRLYEVWRKQRQEGIGTVNCLLDLLDKPSAARRRVPPIIDGETELHEPIRDHVCCISIFFRVAQKEPHKSRPPVLAPAPAALAFAADATVRALFVDLVNTSLISRKQAH